MQHHLVGTYFILILKGNQLKPFLNPRVIPMPCKNFQDKLIKQMEEWRGDENCGQLSDKCTKLPCGQNCLYYVSLQILVTTSFYLKLLFLVAWPG